VITALREANQVGNLQPTTLVSYDADIDDVFDSRDEAALAAEGMDAVALGDPTWLDRMKVDGEAKTQGFARRLIDAGHNGLLVRSFAAGSGVNDLNLVLWRWAGLSSAHLTLIEDENRLSR
jgi:RES domain-containing protein